MKKQPRSTARSVPTVLDPGSFYIVGIGASAGGLTAFKELLQELTPQTGMAFIIIQHLSPRYESLLPEILGRETQMPVVEITDQMKVQPDQVYVLPPNYSLTIHGGVLHLVDRDPDERVPLPIDSFLKSLAKDQQEKAIGIVLSGTGMDGAEGARVLKASGGITFAQSPESAQYASMPASAIRADDVDFILPPREIARELNHLNQFPLQPPAEGSSFNEVLSLLKRRMGTDFSQYKQSTIHRRMTRRLILTKTINLASYLEYLKNSPLEARALAEDILIHVTEFFREPDALEFLRRKVFPNLILNAGDQPIRIWVPGCATGEEAYSIAMELADAFQDTGTVARVQIFATDLSEKSIEKARLGRYPQNIIKQVSSERIKRYFVEDGDAFLISKDIREMCVFARHDLTRDPPFSKLHLISCRNVLIYFSQALQGRMMEMFHYSLNLDGYLLLSKSESIGLATDLFAPTDPKQKIYSRKSGLTRQTTVSWKMDQPILPDDRKHAPNNPPLNALQVQAEIDRVILARHTPPTVVIDNIFDILQVRGYTDPFLPRQESEVYGNLLKILPSNISAEIRRLVDTARKKGNTVQKEGVVLNGQKICIEVTPVLLIGSPCHIITFQATTGTAGSKTGGRARGKSSTKSKMTAVEEELISTKERLQRLIRDFESANQDLQSANEEVVSANEELQSTNEELETSKEELQSTNEELNTVNDELQSRNQELFVLNNDLLNLLNSFSLPVIIVGNDLTLRRFTPTASKILNVKAGDVGRPITDITSNLIDVGSVTQAIREVIETATIFERELQDNQGNWHQLRVRPYKTQDQKLEGAVVTLLDISQFKREYSNGR